MPSTIESQIGDSKAWKGGYEDFEMAHIRQLPLGVHVSTMPFMRSAVQNFQVGPSSRVSLPSVPRNLGPNPTLQRLGIKSDRVSIIRKNEGPLRGQ